MVLTSPGVVAKIDRRVTDSDCLVLTGFLYSVHFSQDEMERFDVMRVISSLLVLRGSQTIQVGFGLSELPPIQPKIPKTIYSCPEKNLPPHPTIPPNNLPTNLSIMNRHREHTKDGNLFPTDPKPQFPSDTRR
ncbi:hypothetical protein RRG08_013400 [Elysia crispata]|uniref:Uncharacterized protein n=1 Tax=Elysia crispata TaxID=231223 RepID=A0AAE1B639_9GAST|nr:hypothetical protein RRG08_013400 [Elysia crispata]